VPRQVADESVVRGLEDEVQRPRLARRHRTDFTHIAALVRLLALEQVSRGLRRLQDDKLMRNRADVRDNEPDLALRRTLRPREDAEFVYLDGDERLRGDGVPGRDGTGDGYHGDSGDRNCEFSHGSRLLLLALCGAAWSVEATVPSGISRTATSEISRAAFAEREVKQHGVVDDGVDDHGGDDARREDDETGPLRLSRPWLTVRSYPRCGTSRQGSQSRNPRKGGHR